MVPRAGLAVRLLLVALVAVACSQAPRDAPAVTGSAASPTAGVAATGPPGAATEPAPEEPVTEATGTATTSPSAIPTVSVQLPGPLSGRFAGYLAAREAGFYDDVGLEVTFREGDPEVWQTVLDGPDLDFAVAWASDALVALDDGADITDVAQVFRRSATVQVAFADSGITAVSDLAGARVGIWGFGRGFELLAGLRSAGIDPTTDVTLVQQDLDVQALLDGEIDAAQALTYDGYADVLAATDGDGGDGAQDVTVIDWNDVGTAMLQDGIWADAGRLDTDPAYHDAAVRFVTASLRGWVHCRDNLADCAELVRQATGGAEPAAGEWTVNEVNRLVWPAPDGIGVMDGASWDTTVAVATSEQVIDDPPPAGAHRRDIVDAALEHLRADGVDVTGASWEAAPVAVPGGEG